MKRTVILNILVILLLLCSCKNISPETDLSDGNINNPVVEENKEENITSDELISDSEEALSDKILRSLEKEYELDSRKDEYLTTVGMIELADKYREKWEKVSIEYYDKILMLVSEKYEDKKDLFKEKLDKLKESYEIYSKDSLNINSEIYKLKYSGGSIIGPLGANDSYEAKKEYALRVIKIYEQLSAY